MPAIEFRNLQKSFGARNVVEDFNADVPDNEFLVLLGPSGCGKSTMLRMMAGLTDITEGDLLFDGERVNDLEPRERNVAFVFQSYALYPHMSVRQNIAFPLIMDRFKAWYHIPVVNLVMRNILAKHPDVASRVAEVAETLELTDYLERRPKALSGGQRQRVALGRALVRAPSIYLLDEPLSNLDAKLRTQMRVEITSLYKRVNKTFVYVTHDQVEAMTMATRIVVLNKGAIQQIGTPDEIYNNPANEFVAKFIGSPAMNLIPVNDLSGRLSIAENGYPLEGAAPPPSTGEHKLGVRPEKIVVRTEANFEGGEIPARVSSVENLGSETLVGFRFHRSEENAAAREESLDQTYMAKIFGKFETRVGDKIGVSFSPSDVIWFDMRGERSIGSSQTQRAANH